MGEFKVLSRVLPLVLSVLAITMVMVVVAVCFLTYKLNSPKFDAGDCVSSAVEEWDTPSCFRILQVGKKNYRVTTCQAYKEESGRYGIVVSMANVPFVEVNKAAYKVECPAGM